MLDIDKFDVAAMYYTLATYPLQPMTEDELDRFGSGSHLTHTPGITIILDSNILYAIEQTKFGDSMGFSVSEVLDYAETLNRQTLGLPQH